MPALDTFSPIKSTSRSTPARTSSNTPAANGSKRILFPPIKLAGARLTRSPFGTSPPSTTPLKTLPPSPPNRTPVEQKVGDYYASCMDEATINKAGIAPLQPSSTASPS